MRPRPPRLCDGVEVPQFPANGTWLSLIHSSRPLHTTPSHECQPHHLLVQVRRHHHARELDRRAVPWAPAPQAARSAELAGCGAPHLRAAMRKPSDFLELAGSIGPPSSSTEPTPGGDWLACGRSTDECARGRRAGRRRQRGRWLRSEPGVGSPSLLANAKMPALLSLASC
jgi:hypothetical protein